jgi:hypothetical protein
LLHVDNVTRKTGRNRSILVAVLMAVRFQLFCVSVRFFAKKNRTLSL